LLQRTAEALSASKAAKSRNKRQRKRARLRAEHARLTGLVQHGGTAKEGSSSAGGCERAAVQAVAEDDIPEDLPHFDDADGPEECYRPVAPTKHVMVHPRAAAPSASVVHGEERGGEVSGRDDSDSDFDTDDILQEVANVHVELLSSHQL